MGRYFLFKTTRYITTQDYRVALPSKKQTSLRQQNLADRRSNFAQLSIHRRSRNCACDKVKKKDTEDRVNAETAAAIVE